MVFVFGKIIMWFFHLEPTNISLIMRTPVVWNKRLKPPECTPKISCQNSNFKLLKVSWEILELELYRFLHGIKFF